MTSAIMEKPEAKLDYDDWADAPLTAEEEEMIRQSREDFKNGDYLTLDEFLKGLEED
ncbi:MAG: hypothetical protein IJP89_11250 [Synergistaceae bacterium]|nr:hypothetical protein [Synergistaceae bacterium]MBR0256800.1 hypothetical protein [Synergistaceae bacterium]